MIGIINYNAGNIKSVANLLDRLGERYIISDDLVELARVDKFIFPGQGRAGPAMRVLKQKGLDKFIQNTSKPFLGICLGMQLLVDYSEEDNTECLGIIPGEVRIFSDQNRLSVPQIGWNKVDLIQNTEIFTTDFNNQYFYFVNSYYVDTSIQNAVGVTRYGNSFVSIIQKDNFVGVQFHPEKSGDIGSNIIARFIKSDSLGIRNNSNLAKRVIACMDIKDGKVVKGTGYKDLEISGDPVKLAKKYVKDGVDELVFLDIGATVESRKTVLSRVSEVAKVVNIPLCVGGGIKTVDDIRRLLLAGADKVSIGSAAINNPHFVKEAVNQFGSQCIVVSIDPKRNGNSWEQYISGGRIATGVDAIEFAGQMVEYGAGELLTNSLDKDGTKSGYDVPLLKKIKESVGIPVIASSGAGKLSNFYDVIQEAGVDAILAAGLFHSGELSVGEVKKYLRSKNINIR
jgi:cyclase